MFFDFIYTSNMIYKQQYAGQCWSYATLNTLQRLWVDISEEKILSLGSMLWFPDIERTLVKNWLAKSLSCLVAPKRIETYLKQGIPLICLMYRNNFQNVRKSPFLQDFNGKMNHFVCLMEDCWDRVKYVDQQGESFWDKWHGYIMKDMLKGNTRVFKINL